MPPDLAEEVLGQAVIAEEPEAKPEVPQLLGRPDADAATRTRRRCSDPPNPWAAPRHPTAYTGALKRVVAGPGPDAGLCWAGPLYAGPEGRPRIYLVLK